MPFDETRWRDEVRQLIADFARDPQSGLARAGTNSVYSLLLGSTII